ETLATLQFSGRALILSDCEGYEKELFPEKTILALAAHDLFVEAHDFNDITISETLQARFQNTHHIQVIQSVDDIRKAYTYSYPELDRFSLAQRRQLLAENRPTVMQWFFMTSKQQAPLST